jgi:hypothetical protein
MVTMSMIYCFAGHAKALADAKISELFVKKQTAMKTLDHDRNRAVFVNMRLINVVQLEQFVVTFRCCSL